MVLAEAARVGCLLTFCFSYILALPVRDARGALGRLGGTLIVALPSLDWSGVRVSGRAGRLVGVALVSRLCVVVVL